MRIMNKANLNDILPLNSKQKYSMGTLLFNYNQLGTTYNNTFFLTKNKILSVPIGYKEG